ncbi:MAG: YkvA family protein [Candidatus Dormibacteria bacterium]
MSRLGLSQLRRIVSELPAHGKVAYCLVRDPRVPRRDKVVLFGALALILGPLDVPAWVPVLGQADQVALTIVALRLFISKAPAHVVNEHEDRVHAHDSTYDHDVVVVRHRATQLMDLARQKVAERGSWRSRSA